MKYIIVSSDDTGDLYTDTVDTREEALDWLEDRGDDTRSIIIGPVPNDTEVEYNT